MENTKKFYQSKTVIGQIVAVICLGLSVSGVVSIDETTQGDIINTIVAVVGITSQIYAIYGRIVANSKIG